MARDRERLLKKERGIEDKRRALIRWEEELKGRENSLQIKERAVSDTEEAPPDKVLQAEKRRYNHFPGSIIPGPNSLPPSSNVPKRILFKHRRGRHVFLVHWWSSAG